MKHRVLVLAGLLLTASCRFSSSESDAANETEIARERSQRAIADDIVSIQHAFGEALLDLDNNRAAEFVERVHSLTARLKRVSKELNACGEFPASLRDATIRQMDEEDKNLGVRNKSRGRRDPLTAQIMKIIDIASDEYFEVSGSVQKKAGLLIKENPNK